MFISKYKVLFLYLLILMLADLHIFTGYLLFLIWATAVYNTVNGKVSCYNNPAIHPPPVLASFHYLLSIPILIPPLP